jgi:hypothetical protein
VKKVPARFKTMSGACQLNLKLQLDLRAVYLGQKRHARTTQHKKQTVTHAIRLPKPTRPRVAAQNHLIESLVYPADRAKNHTIKRDYPTFCSFFSGTLTLESGAENANWASLRKINATGEREFERKASRAAL